METLETRTILESITQPDWVINGWKIHFLFSEKQLHQARKLSTMENWYEDPLVIDTCQDRLRVCFRSIRNFYDSFGTLPIVGDRLFDEDLGMIIQERSIHGDLMVISFMLGT